MSKADNKELGEAVKNIEEFIEDYRIAEEIVDGDFIDNLETVLKELERLQEKNNKLERANKTYINSIQSITPVLLEDYIKKDKIIKEIEELQNMKVDGEVFKTAVNFAIKVLKKILEGK